MLVRKLNSVYSVHWVLHGKVLIFCLFSKARKCSIFLLWTWPRSYILLFETSRLQACIKLLKANNGNTTEMCEICSKLSIKTPERGYFDVLIANFKNIRDISSLTSLLTLNRFKTLCWCFTNRAGVNFKKCKCQHGPIQTKSKSCHILLFLLLKSTFQLNHFRPMFHLCRNQVVGFYWQNVEKTPVEEWHFASKK